MLWRKMLREIRMNVGQFISLFILSFLGITLFASMKASNISAYNRLSDLREATDLADGWIYSENFSTEDLEAIKNIEGIKQAERRFHIRSMAVENDQAQMEVFIVEENTVSRPYVVSGQPYDVNKTDSVWISESFAEEWNLNVGEPFSFYLNGEVVTRKVAGWIVSPEYQVLQAQKDLDIVRKNISVVYLPMDKEDLEKLPFNEIAFTSENKDVKSMEKEIVSALNGNYSVFCDRDDLPGIKVMQDELTQHDQFAFAFPVIFLLIAILVIMTSMNRMIAKQRVQIGTMRALGIKRRKIIFHYLSYSGLVSFLGALCGLFFGTYVLGEYVSAIFRQWYYIPGWDVEMDASFLIVLVLIVLCCMAATYFSCRKVMNIHPAESFRPASPKSGKPTVFEKLPFWNKLGFASQYDLRDISRGKLRAFMGVFGTAAGMMIMVAALASFSTIDKVSAMTFDKIQNFKNEIDFSETITIEKAEEYKDLCDGELILATAVEVAPSRDSLSEDRKQTSLMVIEGEGRWNLTDTDGQIRSIPSGTCAITRKLADTLGVKVGDKLHFHLYEKNTWYELEVGLINRHPTYSGVTMLRSDYEALGETYIPTKLFTQQETLSSIDTTSNGVLAVHDDEDLQESLRIVLEMLYTVIGIFIAFAVILPMVVLFNSGNLSFNERVKEFATLKVLGFKTKRIRKLLSLQNLWLSVLGVILGAPFGTMLLQYMFDSNGDAYDFPVYADWWVYVVSGGFVILISVLVGFMFNRKIKKLDMVEILKGMD